VSNVVRRYKESKFGKTGQLLGLGSKVFPREILTFHIEKLLSMRDSKDYISIIACGVLHNAFIVTKQYQYNTQKEGFRLNEYRIYRCTESKYLLYEHRLTAHME
jgi:hypothetical protein